MLEALFLITVGLVGLAAMKGDSRAVRRVLVGFGAAATMYVAFTVVLLIVTVAALSAFMDGCGEATNEALRSTPLGEPPQ